MSTTIGNNAKKQIKFGAILSYLLIFIEIGISLVFTPWMIRVLGESDYAVYTIVFSLISLFLFDFGISMSATKFLSKYRHEGKHEMAHNLLSMFLKIYVVIDVLIFISLFVIYFFIDNIYVGLEPETISVLKNCYLVFGIYSLVAFPSLNIDALFNAYERFIPLKICTIVQKVLTTLLMFLALYFGRKVFDVILINALVGLFIIIAKFILAYRNIGFKFNVRFFDKTLIKVVIGFSLWIAIISLRDKLINGLIPTILGSVSNEAEVGYYGYGMTLLTYAYTFSTVISGLFLHSVTNIMSKKDNGPALYNLMLKIGKIQLFILALIFSGFIVFGKQFLILFIGEQQLGSYLVCILLLIPFLFTVTKQIALTASYVTDNVKKIAIFNLISAVLCVSISFLTGKYFGAVGVAVCYCVSSLLCEILCDIFVYYKKMKINIMRLYAQTIGKIIFPCLITIALGFLFTSFVKVDNILMLAVGVILFTIIYLILTVFTFFTYSDRKQFLTNQKSSLYNFRKQNDNNENTPKIVWITQRFDQSIAPICDALKESKKCDLKVVLFDALIDNDSYRVKYDRDYVYVDGVSDAKTVDFILTQCDAIILGQASFKKIVKYAQMGKLIFRVSEPLYKEGRSIFRMPLDYLRYCLNHKRYRKFNMFYLTIGSKGYSDLLRFDNYYENRAYKWGYFPLSIKDIQDYNNDKHQEHITILWTGKLIKLKRPLDAAKATKYILDKGYSVKTTIIGSGPEEEKIKEYIAANDLGQFIELLPPVTHSEILRHMRDASIYLFTSNFKEGWGMVLNESISNGCACLASSEAGASEILINDGENGLLYSNSKEFYSKINELLEREKRMQLGSCAYSK